MEKRLTAASKLISGLTGERTRWTADIESLNKNKVQLVGDCLLAASFLSYSGASAPAREQGSQLQRRRSRLVSADLWTSDHLEAWLLFPERARAKHPR